MEKEEITRGKGEVVQVVRNNEKKQQACGSGDGEENENGGRWLGLKLEDHHKPPAYVRSTVYVEPLHVQPAAGSCMHCQDNENHQ